MKPAPFSYVRAASVEDAVAALAASGGEAKLLAGGQSLVPMLNFRLVDAPVFVDINGIAGLDTIEATADGGLHLGALTRHYTVETSDDMRERFPVVTEAMQHVAHLAIHNRGTIGGSLSHADPAAEWPMLSVLLDATLSTARSGGGREIAARDFFVAPLTTALEDDEMVIGVTLPGLPARAGWGFEEFAQRRGDFAVAGAAAIIVLEENIVSEARIALMGVHDTPFRADAAETLLTGREPDAEAIEAAADAAHEAVDPMNDLHGSEEYRRHLTGVLTRRALESAVARAQVAGA